MTFFNYEPQLRFLADVTKMLNEGDTDDEFYFLKVQLVEKDTERVVGEWSDEISSDCWSFSEVEPNEGD